MKQWFSPDMTEKIVDFDVNHIHKMKKEGKTQTNNWDARALPSVVTICAGLVCRKKRIGLIMRVLVKQCQYSIDTRTH